MPQQMFTIWLVRLIIVDCLLFGLLLISSRFFLKLYAVRSGGCLYSGWNWHYLHSLRAKDTECVVARGKMAVKSEPLGVNYLLYFPIKYASASTCPFVALSSSSFVNPALKFNIVSRAYNLK